MIKLSYKLAPQTEKRLREYVRREFRCSLEEKLHEVVKLWIGKAIEHIIKEN